jgi:hypothetical protein
MNWRGSTKRDGEKTTGKTSLAGVMTVGTKDSGFSFLSGPDQNPPNHYMHRRKGKIFQTGNIQINCMIL